ncbi:MAG: iron chelate uptake ABC transporter family permease subunit [Adlercreutzia equolifaciens]
MGASGLARAAGGGLTFAGLVCPHTARRLVGPNFRTLVPAMRSWARCSCVLADIVSRIAACPQRDNNSSASWRPSSARPISCTFGEILGEGDACEVDPRTQRDFPRLPREGAPQRPKSSMSLCSARPAIRTCEEFADAALRGEAVSVGYGDRVIIEPMDVAVPAGEITSIIGPNGCREVHALAGRSRTAHSARRGAVYPDGRAIAEMPTAEVARQMALLPQSPQAPAGLTVGELVALGRYPHQKGFGRLTDDDRSIIGLGPFHHALDGLLAERPIDALSGGQRQGGSWIAMALAQDTGLILPGTSPPPTPGHGPPTGGAGASADAQPRPGQRPSRSSSTS